MRDCLEFLMALLAQRRRLSRTLAPEQEQARALLVGGTAAAVGVAAASSSTSSRPWLLELTEELQRLILAFLPGGAGAWFGATLPASYAAWRTALVEEAWWRSRCNLEFFAPAPLPTQPHGGWNQKYRELFAARGVTSCKWCYRSTRHGLADRVAQPQFFVGPAGQKLFNYGGWSRQGPQSDLHWVPLATVCNAVAAPSEEWRFQPAETRGRTVTPAGVQTLTPLWSRGEAPSAEYVRATATELGDVAAAGEGAGLVLAFGGGQGSYRHEHNEWAVGVLYERDGDEPPRVHWGKPSSKGEPTPRAAHTATYVPARLAGLADEFDEGCVVVFGGHTDNCLSSLASVDILDLKTWRWRLDSIPHERPLERHGHSATLVEVDGRGYLVVVGGGLRNILGYDGEELDDAAVLDLTTWSWVARLSLARSRNIPIPGRHHSASAGLHGEIFLFGGGTTPSNTLCVLDGRECVRQALAGGARGQLPRVELREAGNIAARVPRSRKMHAAASLLPWAPLFMIYGGWEHGPHFDDLWVCGLGGPSADLGALVELQDGAAEASGGEDGDGDFEGGEVPVMVRLAGPDGVRVVRVLPHVLMQMVRLGHLRPHSESEDEQ